MTDAATIERIAKAMAESNGFCWDYCDKPTWRRDAQLAVEMSAAPDLLRELRGALCPGGGLRGPRPLDEYPDVSVCLKANACGCSLGAAVAKAEGRE